LTNKLIVNLNNNTRDKVESMSNKYVPRFLSAKVSPAVTPSDQAPAEPSKPVAPSVTPSRWARDEDIYRISPKKQNLVNTSLPAKMAPVLAPATLSALTAQEKRTSYKSKEVALSSEADFPTLGGKKVVKVTPAAPSKSFSELSKEWAKTQKEDEAKAKEEEAAEAQRLQQQKKKEDEEFIHHGVRNMTLRTKHQRYVKQRDSDEDEEAELTPPEEDDNGNDDADDADDEDEEEEYDGNWNARKHRDELY
jgi:hypothetical protein